MHEPIRILLVDDIPRFTWDTHARYPALPVELTDLFEFIWVQDALEARWLLDAFEFLSQRAPQQVLAAGFPPEILIFDYALTQGRKIARSADDPSYRIPALQALLDHLSIQLPHRHPDDQDDPPPTDTPLGKDRTGCYIGGELSRAFAAHPCGAVPTTAHVETTESDAAFYEWLNRGYFMDLFKDKSRVPTWETLLVPALRSLRRRIVQLATAGVLRIAHQPVRRLADDPSCMVSESFVFTSVYGRRVLPIRGLFFDQLTGSSTPEMFSKAATEWATHLLVAMFRGHGQDQINSAKDLTAHYWDASLSEACDERYELSDLAATAQLAAEANSDMDELCSRIGINPLEARNDPAGVSVTKPGYVLGHWRRSAHNDDVVARWTALLMTVRAEQHHRLATEDGLRLSKLLSDEDVFDRVVARHWLEDRVGKEEVGRLVNVLRLERLDGRGDEVVQVPIAKAAEVDDVLIALDPLPETLLTFLNRGRMVKGRRIKDATSLTNALKRLGVDGGSWGTLGLSLSDVLDNNPFDCVLCQSAIDQGVAPPEGEHRKPADGADNPGEKYHHGIRKGEGLLLRTYADEMGFPEEKWPVWLKHAP